MQLNHGPSSPHLAAQATAEHLKAHHTLQSLAIEFPVIQTDDEGPVKIGALGACLGLLTGNGPFDRGLFRLLTGNGPFDRGLFRLLTGNGAFVVGAPCTRESSTH